MFRKPFLAVLISGVIASAGGCAQTPPAPDTAADQAKLQSDALIWFDQRAAQQGAGVDAAQRGSALPLGD